MHSYLPESFPESLPSLCEYCGVPESISLDAPVSERYELLQKWTALCHQDFLELPAVLSMSEELKERLYAYIYENILRLVLWSVCDFETFRSDLLECVETSACWAKLPAAT